MTRREATDTERRYWNAWRVENSRVWRDANLEYAREYQCQLWRGYRTGGTVPPRTPYEPHEDALIARIPSNVAAASALGRTVESVINRRARLKREGASRHRRAFEDMPRAS